MAWLWWIGAALVLGVIETLTVDLTFPTAPITTNSAKSAARRRLR